MQLVPGVRLRERLAIGGGRQRETVWNANALGGQFAIELAERSILSSDQGHIPEPNSRKPTDIIFRLHGVTEHELYQYAVASDGHSMIWIKTKKEEPRQPAPIIGRTEQNLGRTTTPKPAQGLLTAPLPYRRSHRC